MTEEIKEILKKTDIDAVSYGVIINYITNLQKENEKLKQWDCNKDTRNSRQRTANKNLLKQLENYKLRNEKAIEYIENDLQISVLPNNQIINGKEVVKRINKILNILQGGDE